MRCVPSSKALPSSRICEGGQPLGEACAIGLGALPLRTPCTDTRHRPGPAATLDIRLATPWRRVRCSGALWPAVGGGQAGRRQRGGVWATGYGLWATGCGLRATGHRLWASARLGGGSGGCVLLGGEVFWGRRSGCRWRSRGGEKACRPVVDVCAQTEGRASQIVCNVCPASSRRRAADGRRQLWQQFGGGGLGDGGSSSTPASLSAGTHAFAVRLSPLPKCGPPANDCRVGRRPSASQTDKPDRQAPGSLRKPVRPQGPRHRLAAGSTWHVGSCGCTYIRTLPWREPRC